MLACKWMGISLRSPLILASLSLCSKPDVDRHVKYFERAIEYGVGAIILPSIHPLRADDTVGEPHIRTTVIPTGLHTNKDYMGFAVLGTTDNIASVSYSLMLAEEAVKLNVPVLGSVANIGTENDFLDVVRKLVAIKNLAGLELNFSCPNVLNGLDLSVELLEKVQAVNINQLPVTIKLAPQEKYDFLLRDQQLIQGITLSNAYTGLIPPQTTSNQITPFDDMENWRPTGIYGPLEKVMTFHDIWKYKSNPMTKCIQLSSVGGLVNSNDVIQAIVLGADSVQLSSAVFWKGLSIFRECCNDLSNFLVQKNLNLSQLKGMGLNFIKASDQEMQIQRPTRRMKVDVTKCKKCVSCACAERSCYAFDRNNINTFPSINANLCSGCGWCREMCLFNAVGIC